MGKIFPGSIRARSRRRREPPPPTSTSPIQPRKQGDAGWYFNDQPLRGRNSGEGSWTTAEGSASWIRSRLSRTRHPAREPRCPKRRHARLRTCSRWPISGRFGERRSSLTPPPGHHSSWIQRYGTPGTHLAEIVDRAPRAERGLIQAPPHLADSKRPPWCSAGTCPDAGR